MSIEFLYAPAFAGTSSCKVGVCNSLETARKVAHRFIGRHPIQELRDIGHARSQRKGNHLYFDGCTFEDLFPTKGAS